MKGPARRQLFELVCPTDTGFAHEDDSDQKRAIERPKNKFSKIQTTSSYGDDQSIFQYEINSNQQAGYYLYVNKQN